MKLTHATILAAAKRLHAREIAEPWDSLPGDAQAAYMHEAEPIIQAALDAAPDADAGRVEDALLSRLRARTKERLPSNWRDGRKCPECGMGAVRYKCFWDLGGACPAGDPDAYKDSPYITEPDADCVAAADRTATLERDLATARGRIERALEIRVGGISPLSAFHRMRAILRGDSDA